MNRKLLSFRYIVCILNLNFYREFYTKWHTMLFQSNEKHDKFFETKRWINSHYSNEQKQKKKINNIKLCYIHTLTICKIFILVMYVQIWNWILDSGKGLQLDWMFVFSFTILMYSEHHHHHHNQNAFEKYREKKNEK